MIFEFALPSNPKIKVRMHEATVADAMDFSGVDPNFEEEAISLFLERVQEKETYTDPREWTGEDRRFAVFMYHCNTTRDKTISLSFKCPVCGEKHTSDVLLSDILGTYTPIEGDDFREFPYNGHNVIVKPMNGGDLETAEKLRYDLLLSREDLESKKDTMTAEQRQVQENIIRDKTVKLTMFNVLCRVDLPFLDEKLDKKGRRPLVEDFIKQMPAVDFKEFFENVSSAIAEMRHGLKMSYSDGQLFVEIPKVHCDNNPEAGEVLLRYPFRCSEYIPTI